MSSEVEILVEMGFEKHRAEKAMSETGNMGIEAAMEWLLSHPEEIRVLEDNLIKTETKDESSKPSSDEGTFDSPQDIPKSLKCEDCGKLFPGIPEAEYHASKSGHSNFTESSDSFKPLTGEEKQTQLLRLQEMMKQRRKEREEKEKQEQLEREKARRNTGKEISQAKQKHEEQELKKVIDQRKREKDEEKMARQRVKDQIEKDKQDREAKYAAQTSTYNQQQQQQQLNQQKQQQQQLQPCTAIKDYTETKLQIRLLDGDKLMESFSVKETLAAVRVYVQQKATQCAQVQFTFATAYPRREFSEDDMQTPLMHLGLVPSAVLMVKKL